MPKFSAYDMTCDLINKAWEGGATDELPGFKELQDALSKAYCDGHAEGFNKGYRLGVTDGNSEAYLIPGEEFW